jgi:hypothetical protein
MYCIAVTRAMKISVPHTIRKAGLIVGIIVGVSAKTTNAAMQHMTGGFDGKVTFGPRDKTDPAKQVVRSTTMHAKPNFDASWNRNRR